MFQGLRQGNLIYILDKNNLTLEIGEVENVSNPAPKFGQGTAFPNQPFGQQHEVDVKAKVGGESVNIEQLPANLSIANKNGMVVSDSCEAMTAEVDAMLRSSRQVLDSIAYHEKVMSECDVMMRKLNPRFAKEKEQEEKIDALEEKMGGIETTLKQMMGLLSDTLHNNRPKKIRRNNYGIYN